MIRNRPPCTDARLRRALMLIAVRRFKTPHRASRASADYLLMRDASGDHCHTARSTGKDSQQTSKFFRRSYCAGDAEAATSADPLIRCRRRPGTRSVPVSPAYEGVHRRNMPARAPRRRRSISMTTRTPTSVRAVEGVWCRSLVAAPVLALLTDEQTFRFRQWKARPAVTTPTSTAGAPCLPSSALARRLSERLSFTKWGRPTIPAPASPTSDGRLLSAALRSCWWGCPVSSRGHRSTSRSRARRALDAAVQLTTSRTPPRRRLCQSHALLKRRPSFLEPKQTGKMIMNTLWTLSLAARTKSESISRDSLLENR